MVASLLELDHGRTVVAPLPSLLLGDLDEPLGLLVLGTFLAGVPLAVASTAHLGLAPAAFAVLPVSNRPIRVDVGRLDPLAAALGRAVDAVLGRVLLVLSIPQHLELQIEQAINVLQRDVVRGAALWRHVLRVRDRQVEDSFETIIAHDVAAPELRRSGDGDVVGEARQTLDPRLVSILPGPAPPATHFFSGPRAAGGMPKRDDNSPLDRLRSLWISPPASVMPPTADLERVTVDRGRAADILRLLVVLLRFSGGLEDAGTGSSKDELLQCPSQVLLCIGERDGHDTSRCAENAWSCPTSGGRLHLVWRAPPHHGRPGCRWAVIVGLHPDLGDWTQVQPDWPRQERRP